MAAGGGAGIPLPLPAGSVFWPNDEELITHYSGNGGNGYMGLIGMLSFVGYLYSMRPEQIPIRGEGRILEEEENGLRTITNEWLVVSYKCGGHQNPVLNGFWIPDQDMVPVRDGPNRSIGYNRFIRFYEQGHGAFWTSVEVTSTNDQAHTVACRLIKTEILPIFNMDETDAALTFDELMDAAFNEDDGDFDG